MSTPIMRKGQAGQAGNPGQFAAKTHAEADESITFLEDTPNFQPPAPDLEPGPENPFVLTSEYTTKLWSQSMDDADALRAEYEQTRAKVESAPSGSSPERYELLDRERQLEEKLSRQRLLTQQAMVRHAASSPEAEEQVLRQLRKEQEADFHDRVDPHGDYGLSVSEQHVQRSAQAMRSGYEKFRRAGIGQGCQRIPAAEARRRLPVGATVTRHVALGPRAGESASGLAIEKQTPYEQIVRTGPGEMDKTHLGWGGNHAYADKDGRIIVCDEADVPFIVYERED